MIEPDDRTRQDFQRLRSETEASSRVPDFEAMLARARADAARMPALEVVEGGGRSGPERRRRRALLLGGWASAAAAAVLAAILLVDRGPSADAEFERLVASYASDASGGAWRSPTSGFLDVPGMELVRSVPSVGTSIRGLDPAQGPAAPPPGGRDS